MSKRHLIVELDVWGLRFSVRNDEGEQADTNEDGGPTVAEIAFFILDFVMETPMPEDGPRASRSPWARGSGKRKERKNKENKAFGGGC